MAERPVADPFCPNCGTEVDADARFCPTCGRTLVVAADEEEREIADDEVTATVSREDEPAERSSAPIPPAPAWPPPPEAESPEAESPEVQAAPEPPPDPSVSREAPPAPEPVSAAASPSGERPAPAGTPTRTAPDLPFTWPATLAGWLIGAGSGLAALSLLPRLGNPLDLLLFLALLGICATVFLADRIPRIGHQRLIILVVLMLGLGVALERAAFTVRGIHTVFLITVLVAAGGALLIELNRDRPVPPPGGAD